VRIIWIFFGVIIFLILFFLWIGAKIYSSNTTEFCISCHEMEIFYNTWRISSHGLRNMGASRARCVDCHLPHTSFFNYLFTKIKLGWHDYWAHLSGKKDSPGKWFIYLKKHRNVLGRRIVYDSGCRRCHKVLIGNGIPLKAVKVHKTYLLGETNKTCVSCHRAVGHGDIITTLTEMNKKIQKGGG
jgi:cytochrome c nitrite reductase small subunit